MNIARSTAALFGAFTLSATLAHGQARLTFSDVKNFKIVGPEEADYEGGSLDVNLTDGTIPFLACLGLTASGSIVNSGAFAVFQAPNRSCPSGTTGLLTDTAFDFDEDGVRDIGLYVSVAQPIPAINVEPFQTSLISLRAAPPSDLPRPIGGFSWTDTSSVIFYDLVNDPRNGRAFEVTSYDSSRPYTSLELERHRDEIVPGSYAFNFPALGTTSLGTPRVFSINVAHRQMTEAYPPQGGRDVVSGGISVGNDFRITNDDRWSNGAMEFDPRVASNFTWEGFNATTFLETDRLFFSIRDRVTGDIVFPPFPPGQEASSQLIAGNGLPIANGYELGPTFFGPGDNIEVELEFLRNLTFGNTTDASVRFFRWDVNLIDSFEGYLVSTFPAGSLDFEIDPDFDYDGDGFTNLEEFGFQTDPLDPASVPNPTLTIDSFTGHSELVIQKRPAVGSRLTYIIEYSVDFQTWIAIDNDDPNWFLVTDDEREISVFSRRPAAVAPPFTRVRFTLN